MFLDLDSKSKLLEEHGFRLVETTVLEEAPDFTNSHGYGGEKKGERVVRVPWYSQPGRVDPRQLSKLKTNTWINPVSGANPCCFLRELRRLSLCLRYFLLQNPPRRRTDILVDLHRFESQNDEDIDLDVRNLF